jgi:hypothetical protein
MKTSFHNPYSKKCQEPDELKHECMFNPIVDKKVVRTNILRKKCCSFNLIIHIIIFKKRFSAAFFIICIVKPLFTSLISRNLRVFNLATQVVAYPVGLTYLETMRLCFKKKWKVSGEAN